MTGQAKLLLIAVFLIALAACLAAENHVDESRDVDYSEEPATLPTRRRELHWQCAGSYRRGKGNGKGAKRGGYEIPTYGYDDDYLLAVDRPGPHTNTLIYGECLPIGRRPWGDDDYYYDSDDDRRNLRGRDIVPGRLLKGRKYYGYSKGKGGGSKGSKGKGSKGKGGKGKGSKGKGGKGKGGGGVGGRPGPGPG